MPYCGRRSARRKIAPHGGFDLPVEVVNLLEVPTGEYADTSTLPQR